MSKPVEVYRGQYLESTHEIHIAVTNDKGELLYYYGDSDRPTFGRSSMKPFQAVPLIETGAAETFNYGKKEISLSCASHSGETIHRSTVLDILERIGLEENALQCGTHIPRDIESYNELIRSGKELTPVFSNCSGKHSGMLATAVKMNEDIETYREISHPVQKRILTAISAVCEFPVEEIGLSVDGCGVPVHQLPIKNIALGFARLASLNNNDFPHRRTLSVIAEAMVSFPEMVGGTDRFDTDLMKVYKGRLVSKAGAEAVQCIGDRETGLGIAIKIEDGGARATSAVAMEVLRQLKIGTEKEFASLEQYVTPPVLNMRKDKIGVIKTNFELKKNK
ncbi:asparaginase [Pullulanibacillus sp. KACC 23026]|uniref:asparaginase n=1 Tax=Pullulanibacillus sp. KACC 23026 TaxID=3028315 RepID=UPI0023B0F407|nr:asparaginase [Pullulanibacillus sp. KACC 23026]WEG12803.1 asparaginase [Pullulanibacillus sp. KACC 23026]